MGELQRPHQDAVRVRGHARGERRERPVPDLPRGSRQGRPHRVAGQDGTVARECRGRHHRDPRGSRNRLQLLLPQLRAGRAVRGLPGGQTAAEHHGERRHGLRAVREPLDGRDRRGPRAERHELLPHQRVAGHPRRGGHVGRRAIVRDRRVRQCRDGAAGEPARARGRRQRQAVHLHEGPRERHARGGRGQRRDRALRLRQGAGEHRRRRQPHRRLRAQTDLRGRERREELGRRRRCPRPMGQAGRQGRQDPRLRRRRVRGLRGRARAALAHQGGS